MDVALIVIASVALVLILSSIKQVNQYERGVLFSLGKFTKVLEPGWHVVLPVFQFYQKIDIRTKVVDVPEQEAITKDNVSVKVNAVVYYSIFDSKLAVIEVEDFYYAISQLALTTMRNIVGTVSLDELLSQRDKISDKLTQIIDKDSDPWGIRVQSVELKEITLPEDMKRVIARVAEAEREKEAVITKADGEVKASENLAKAAKNMSETPGALHLRTLTTLAELGSDKSNTIILALPIEMTDAIAAMTKGVTKK